MPDLSTRPQREAQLSAAVWQVLRDEAARLEAGGLPNWPEFERRLQAAMIEPLAITHEEAATALLLLIDDPVIQPNREQLANDARQWAATMAAAIAQGMAANMQADVAAARQGGTLSAALPVIFSQARAENIGITETTRAVSQGERGAVRRFELSPSGPRTVTAIWQTEVDSKVCPVCRPLHNKRAEIWEQQFPTGPPAHPRCRCYLTYQLGPTSSN